MANTVRSTQQTRNLDKKTIVADPMKSKEYFIAASEMLLQIITFMMNNIYINQPIEAKKQKYSHLQSVVFSLFRGLRNGVVEKNTEFRDLMAEANIWKNPPLSCNDIFCI